MVFNRINFKDFFYVSKSLYREITNEKSNNGTNFLPMRASPSCLEMNGKEGFHFAVHSVPQAIEAALKEAELKEHDLDWLLLHQARSFQYIWIFLFFFLKINIQGVCFLYKSGLFSTSQCGSTLKKG